MSNPVTIGKKEFFKGIGKIPFEGSASRNPLAFKYYDENKVVAGKPMKDHFRFAIAYWHTFCGNGGDPFGPAGTVDFPWDASSDPMQAAKDKLDAAFEFITKLGVPFYCFHDRDMAPEGKTVKESEKNLKELVALAKRNRQAPVSNCFGVRRMSFPISAIRTAPRPIRILTLFHMSPRRSKPRLMRRSN